MKTRDIVTLMDQVSGEEAMAGIAFALWKTNQAEISEIRTACAEMGIAPPEEYFA